MDSCAKYIPPESRQASLQYDVVPSNVNISEAVISQHRGTVGETSVSKDEIDQQTDLPPACPKLVYCDSWTSHKTCLVIAFQPRCA